MNSWTDIVKTALLGTTTTGQIPASIYNDLNSLGMNVSAEESMEVTLLEAAAALATFRKAGVSISQTLDSLPYEPCELDDMPLCSPIAANYLSQILQQNQEEIMQEWLSVIEKLQQRIPEELLPDVLSYGAMHEKIRRAIMPALGKRGTWLAQFNNRWAYALDATIDTSNEEPFQLGSPKERIDYLQKRREQDPKAALNLIESVWESEDYQSKVDFLKVLNTHLSVDDLPFIEMALEDKRKEVRNEAAALLAMLPESSLIQRMILALSEWVNFNPKKKSLELELPDSLSTEMKRDGIREHFQPLPEGKKANWLAQMISLVPPSHWAETWKMSIEDCLEMAINSDYRNVWYWGWSMAAKRLNDEEWLLGIHRYILKNKPTGKKGLHFALDFLYQDLHNELFNLLAWEYLQKDRNALLSDDHPVLTLLLQEFQIWEDKLAIEVIHRIQHVVSNDSAVFNWNQKTLLKRAAYAINPLLYNQLELGWPTELGYSWQSEVTNFLATLRFRKNIYELNK